jgi:hypothetical protein
MLLQLPEPIRGRTVAPEKRNVIMFYVLATAYTVWGVEPFSRKEFAQALTERYANKLGTTPHMNQTTQAARERYFLTIEDKRVYRLSDHAMQYLHRYTYPTGDDVDGLMPIETFRALKNTRGTSTMQPA